MSATQKLIWLRGLLSSINHLSRTTTLLLIDNQGEILLIKNSLSSKHSKHIKLRLFVKNSLMGQLLPNISLQMSSWLMVLPKPLLASNLRNLSKNSVLLKKCSLSEHVVIHLSCFMLSFYSTSHSFLLNLFHYIRLDCIFLCATQFSPQFHTTKTEVSIRCFLYVLFIVWHVPSHNCSRYIQIPQFHAIKTESWLF